MPPDPFNDYARSRWEAEKRLMEWAHGEPDRSLVIVRPSVVFGEGNRGNVHNLPRQVHSVRIRKFCAETTVNTERLAGTGFVAPYSLEEGLRRMIGTDLLGSPSPGLEHAKAA